MFINMLLLASLKILKFIILYVYVYTNSIFLLAADAKNTFHCAFLHV